MRVIEPSRDATDALRRVRARQEIVAQLVGGGLSLSEAAIRFHALGRQQALDAERACREVIGWAYLALGQRPERAEARCLELERELQSNLERAS